MFTLIHENKLRVILTAGDMEALGLHCDRLDYADPDTRGALASILDQGRAQARFDPQKAKLFVEAYPCEDGGCVLYFTCLNGARGDRAVMEPVMFEFEAVGDLTRGAARVFERYGQRIYRSSLYRMKGRYRLAVYPLDYADRLSVYFLSEYGRKVGEGELLAAFTAEHGEELIRDEAIEWLAEHLGD